ncbi:hypothetical protein RclHR1_23140004 [Rhizophagus clarus]|uniref:RNase H type-1 domain-containing protein n=1 Tax=Rhizophagus clarus TaxID=94130 RepID=A0A2Z6QW68_9GLOM|nr:hypothetical protein RclHR1_23140004 [Rhizophagus clarus]
MLLNVIISPALLLPWYLPPFKLQHANSTSLYPGLTLPGHTPLYSCMSPKTFKACLKVLRRRHMYYLSQLITPTGTHLVSWTAYQTAYIALLTDKRGRSLPHKWYLDIQATTTIPDSHDHLYDRYVCSPTDIPAVSLVPGVTTNQKNRHWLVTLDGNAAPLFGKQLTIQPKKDTCTIVHWTSDCLSSPGDVIRLRPCPGCEAHIPFPAANKYSTVEPRCTFTVSLLRSLILPTYSERIRLNTTEVVSPYSWADLCTMVVSYYTRLSIPPDFSSSLPVVNDDLASPPVLCDSSGLPSPVVLLPGSHYRYYTDGSLINLRTPAVSMGWSWVQIIPDAGYLNSVATYAYGGTIRNWPSSTRAETAAIYAALSVTLEDSVVSIYTDSQAAIDVKGHDGNYWNDFADSLANSAHQSDDAFPLPEAIFTFSHSIRLVYDDIIFYFCLTDQNDYIVDWDLTWFILNFSPSHDASFQAHHASRHYTFKFMLFLDDLPLLEKLKITRPDLYIDLLTCRSCCIRKEDLMHFILCSKRHTAMHQILQSYQNHLFSKLREAGELADVDPTPMIRNLLFLAGLFPLLIELSIPRQSAMKIVAAIHDNFVQKLRKHIWNLRTYDKSRWEDAMHITLKLKTSPQPSNLPASTYVPFSSLPPLTHLVNSRDFETDWIKDSMIQGLLWYNHLSGFMGRLTVLLNNSFCRIGCRFL